MAATAATALKGQTGKSTTAKRGHPMAKAAPASPEVTGGNYVEAPPNAFKTLTSLRMMGYDTVASVSDLVDNCIDAGATRVSVEVRQAGKGGKDSGDTGIVIDVQDNGIGMDGDTLNQALRLGSETSHENTDLGKYGMGLVTASLGMARSIYVLTRKDKAQAYEAVLDIDDVAKHNKFLIALQPVADSRKVLSILKDHGTLVRVSKIDRIDDVNVARFAATLRTKFAQTYRTFLNAGLKLAVNNRLVEPFDPLMRDHPQTKVLLDQDLSVDGHTIHVTAVDLPDLGFAGNQGAGIFPHTSGVYVVRNGRQIMAAQRFGLYQQHHSYSGFRAELSFGKDADALFHVDVMKQKVQPTGKLLAKLSEALGDAIAEAGRSGRERPVAETATQVKIDHAADLLNARLSQPAAKPVAKAREKGSDEDGETNGATPHLNDGTDKPEAAPPEDKSPVKWMQESLPSSTQLYRAVEKDGRWVIVLNTNHPLQQMVANARHKAASSVLTYMVFALASATAGKKNGQDITDEIGATLASILGTPEA